MCIYVNWCSFLCVICVCGDITPFFLNFTLHFFRNYRFPPPPPRSEFYEWSQPPRSKNLFWPERPANSILIRRWVFLLFKIDLCCFIFPFHIFLEPSPSFTPTYSLTPFYSCIIKNFTFFIFCFCRINFPILLPPPPPSHCFLPFFLFGCSQHLC